VTNVINWINLAQAFICENTYELSASKKGTEFLDLWKTQLLLKKEPVPWS
jgi:hypothetical protein